jgi:hypothetical protein
MEMFYKIHGKLKAYKHAECVLDNKGFRSSRLLQNSEAVSSLSGIIFKIEVYEAYSKSTEAWYFINLIIPYTVTKKFYKYHDQILVIPQPLNLNQ